MIKDLKTNILLLLLITLCSCTDGDVYRINTGETYDDAIISPGGAQYPGLNSSTIYCGPGWGRKLCRFLAKYNGTVWADADNYYSDFSDIKFSNFFPNEFFISFFDLDSVTTYCSGWKLGENTHDGKKWYIRLKKDQEDELWFDLEYYGTSEEIEHTTTYKYKVINGSLHFSTTDGQTFVFEPSQRNYAPNAVGTDEVVVLDGCMFY